jgi:hypothetical protein
MPLWVFKMKKLYCVRMKDNKTLMGLSGLFHVPKNKEGGFMHKFLAVITCTIFFIGCNGPKVPHKIEDRSDKSCLSCHLNGDNNSPKMPHRTKSNCLKCHE